MLMDTKILQRHGIYEVLAESQAIVFASRGSPAVLHFVRRNGVDDIYLRALKFEESRWLVFDLRSIDRNFETDLAHALHRDRPGMVLFTLRAQFQDADAFLIACMRNLETSWLARDPLPRLLLRDVQTPAICFQPEIGRAAA